MIGALLPWTLAVLAIAAFGACLPRLALLGQRTARLDEENTHLRAKLRSLQREVGRKDAVLHQKNIMLSALHYVFCSGGCAEGVHRHDEAELSEELVAAAERNTARLRAALTNRQAQKNLT